jgi:hypothetical protein
VKAQIALRDITLEPLWTSSIWAWLPVTTRTLGADGGAHCIWCRSA